MTDPIKFISHGYDPARGKDSTVAMLIYPDGHVEDIAARFADDFKRGLNGTVRALRDLGDKFRRINREHSVYWKRYQRRGKYVRRAR